MSPADLVKKYMDIVFGDGDLESLNDILADNLEFRGPFFEFDSSREYIDSLKSSPPDNFSYEMLNTFENEDSICLIYRFTKPGVSTPMCQVFEISAGKITKILLIFDTKLFE